MTSAAHTLNSIRTTRNTISAMRSERLAAVESEKRADLTLTKPSLTRVIFIHNLQRLCYSATQSYP
jgi:hypothetical protein